MFEAKDVDFDKIPEGEPLRRASKDGYGFAKGGGVAQAVANYINRVRPDMEVNVVKAEGLSECKKMMMMATKGKYDGCLIEGMACPGGCIGGAGTLQVLSKSEKNLDVAIKEARVESPLDNEFAELIPTLEKLDFEV